MPTHGVNFFGRHEHLYEKIEENLLRTDEIPRDVAAIERLLVGVTIVLSTLSTLSNPALHSNGFFRVVPVERLVIDEASQIKILDFMVRLTP